MNQTKNNMNEEKKQRLIWIILAVILSFFFCLFVYFLSSNIDGDKSVDNNKQTDVDDKQTDVDDKQTDVDDKQTDVDNKQTDVDNKQTDKTLDNKDENKDNNKTEVNCTLQATSANEFVKYVTSYVYSSEPSCSKYVVTYKNIKYEVEHFKVIGAVSSLYLNNKKYEIVNNDYHDGVYLSQVNLLNAGSDKFLFLFNEVPVTEYISYYVILLNENGEVEFSESSVRSAKFNTSTNELTYTVYVNELPNVINVLCEYVNTHSRDEILTKDYTYKFENGKLNLKDTKITTIADVYKEDECKDFIN